MNLTSHMSRIDDVGSLSRIETLLVSLQKLLANELEAIARCDFSDIETLNSEKTALVADLEAAMSASSSSDQSGASQNTELNDLRERVVSATGQVRAMAHANTVLMGDAMSAITAKLGIDTRAQSYDRRARKVTQARRYASKSV